MYTVADYTTADVQAVHIGDIYVRERSRSDLMMICGLRRYTGMVNL